MKVAITGGAGFLGKKLIQALKEKGYSVRILLRSPQKEAELHHLGLEIVRGDLADIPALERLCDGVDYVFHTAGVISYNPQKNKIMHETNVLGTRAIAQAAFRAKVKKMIHTSSTAAIGINTNPHQVLNEDSPFNAAHLGLAYFTSKYDAELEVKKYCEQGLNAVIVNPGSLLGPGDTRRYEKGYAGLIYKYNPPFLFHGGINFVDVDDVVQGHLLALEKGRVGERYILGGENVSFAAFIERTNKIIGRKSPKIFIPLSLMGALSVALKGLNRMGVDLHMTPELVRQVCTWYLYVDSSKAQKELGYQPHNIERSIKSTLDWLKQIGRIS